MQVKEPLSLQDAKDFLRVEHDLDDGYITSLITLARSYVESYQNRHIAQRVKDTEDEVLPEVSPASALEKQAILLLIAHFYEERQPLTASNRVPMPLGIQSLLYFNRNLKA